MAFLQLLSISFYLIVTKLSFDTTNRRNNYKFNISELVVVRIYIACMTFVFNCLFLFLDDNWFTLLDVFITYWVYLQLFEKGAFKTFLRILWMYSLLLLILFFIGIILVISLHLISYHRVF